jgi:hypothetical protein
MATPKVSHTDPLEATSKSSALVSRQEVDAIIPLLERKLREDGVVNDDGSVSEYAKKFVTESLAPNLRMYVRKAPWYKNRYRWMASTIITAGLLTSALGAVAKNSKDLSSAATYGIIILGILIGVLSHWLQIWKPSERAVAFYHARTALRHEIWDFLTDEGIYEKPDGKRRFTTLVRQVMKIETDATVIDEQRDTAVASSSSGSGRSTSS